MKKSYLVFLIFIFCFVGSLIATIEYSEIPSLLPANLANPENASNTPVYLKTIPDIRNILILEDESFLEVNLSAMRIKLYQDGKMTKEWPILLKGDPQGWGGSPAGLYKILSSKELGFSNISNVYMPYTHNYYGKYHIHGEPYYPGGTKRITIFTGGCIQLYNQYAKEIYKLVDLNMPVLVIDKERDDYQYYTKNLSDLPEISAKSYLAADLDSGFIFAEKNSQEKLPVSYLSQLMTAIVVSENIDLRRSILVKAGMLTGFGSTGGMEAGKSFRTVELFYPLLIESSNDAAEVLSYFLGRDKTVEMMNEKAKAILMDKTEFIDPQGFDVKNVSTAQDLFQLSRYLLNARPPLLEITKGKEVKSFGEVSFDIKEMWNKNIFINDPNFIGGKTGFLSAGDEAVASSSPFANARVVDERSFFSTLRFARVVDERSFFSTLRFARVSNALFIFKFPADEANDAKNRNIVIILLGSENSKNDTQNIYRWLLENYSLSPALET